MSCACVLHFAMSSSAFHIMSSCASHSHTCLSYASEHFPRCPFCNPALLCSPASPFTYFSCAGIKLSRNGPRLDMWTWFTTGRPPVKFRIIWSPFDTPTVNRVTDKASFVMQPNTPPKWPKTHPNSLHLLGRSITIVWAKTALHLELPSPLYLYKHLPLPKFTDETLANSPLRRRTKPPHRAGHVRCSPPPHPGQSWSATSPPPPAPPIPVRHLSPPPLRHRAA